MRSPLNLVALSMIAIAIAFSRVGPARAQNQPPSPEMLLNLDLFSSKSQDEEGGANATEGESLLDQIRTLNQIGLLSGGRGTPAGYPVPGDRSGGAAAPPPSAPYGGPQSDDGGGLPE